MNYNWFWNSTIKDQSKDNKENKAIWELVGLNPQNIKFINMLHTFC